MTMESEKNQKHQEDTSITTYTSLGLGIGLSLGVFVGILIDDIGLGMTLGVALGLCIGPAVGALRKNKNADRQEDDDEKQ